MSQRQDRIVLRMGRLLDGTALSWDGVELRRRQVGTARSWNGAKLGRRQVEMAPSWDGAKLKRPQNFTAPRWHVAKLGRHPDGGTLVLRLDYYLIVLTKYFQLQLIVLDFVIFQNERWVSQTSWLNDIFYTLWKVFFIFYIITKFYDNK